MPPFDRRTIPDALRYSTRTMADGWRIRVFRWSQPVEADPVRDAAIARIDGFLDRFDAA